MLRISAGFAYSMKCPVNNFTESNEKCYGRYIQRQMLDFKSDNDLIASGSSWNITKACRSVRNLSYNFLIRYPELNMRRWFYICDFF